MLYQHLPVIRAQGIATLRTVLSKLLLVLAQEVSISSTSDILSHVPVSEGGLREIETTELDLLLETGDA
ncbi:hypothetical protein GCM10010439_11380 [Actinocorallia aurantiaca]|uniref:Uncharacterized protein n=1 Tax=Actinocorallia aurantiaca TaxID=46204 RepID=A0ABN3TZM3_9ACTN